MISFILSISLLLPAAVVGKDYFTAAVLEHRPEFANETDIDPREVLVNSLEIYKKAILQAKQKGADIILFNEYGLFEYPRTRENFKKFAENVPDPKKYKFNPCTDKTTDRYILHALSCLARKNSIYIVANLADIQSCEESCYADNIDSCRTKCPEDGVYIYNTNVAFDTEGYIIARYHKMHPYFEVVNVPDEPDFATFETEFGKFGMIVCFDSIFQESVQLVKDHGIDTILFPTFWFDDILPLNGVEWQQAWAIANGVNFLAANTQYAFTGSLGSGIYSKDGALVYTYEPDDNSKLLVANLRIKSTKSTSEIPEENSITVITKDGAFPKVENGEMFPEQCYDKLVGPPKAVLDYRCFKTQTQNYTLVKLNNPTGTAKSCNNGFCCKLTYEAEDMQEEFYLAAFSGLNNVHGYYYWWEEVCLVVRCDPLEGKPCVMQPSRSKTVFTSASLSAEFTSERIYPTVSETNFRLASRTEWTTFTSGSVTTLKFHTDSHKPLLKIGLVGRKYEHDPVFIPYY